MLKKVYIYKNKKTKEEFIRYDVEVNEDIFLYSIADDSGDSDIRGMSLEDLNRDFEKIAEYEEED